MRKRTMILGASGIALAGFGISQLDLFKPAEPLPPADFSNIKSQYSVVAAYPDAEHPYATIRTSFSDGTGINDNIGCERLAGLEESKINDGINSSRYVGGIFNAVDRSHLARDIAEGRVDPQNLREDQIKLIGADQGGSIRGIARSHADSRVFAEAQIKAGCVVSGSLKQAPR